MVVAGCGIGVFKGAISDSEITTSFSSSATKISVLSGSVLFGVARLFEPMILLDLRESMVS